MMITINNQNVNGPNDVVAVLAGVATPFPSVALSVTAGDAANVEIADGMVRFSAPGLFTLSATHGFEVHAIRIVACDPAVLTRFHVAPEHSPNGHNVELQRLFVLRSAARWSRFDGTLESCVDMNWQNHGASKPLAGGAVRLV
jgi:hypothetical protein